MYREYRECSPKTMETTTEDRSPPKSLHEAVATGDAESLSRLLVSPSCDLSLRDGEGATPLYRASEQGRTELVRLLLQAGAHVNARKRKRWTPLHAAAKNGHVDVMTQLVTSGANVTRVTNRSMTPLMLSAKHGNVDAVRFLLERGSSDLYARDMFDRTVLIWAVKGGDKTIFEELVAAGADFRAEDQFRKSPVIQSVKSDKPAILEYLINKGVDLSLEEKHYRAPIHMAASKGRPECLRVLLDHGVPPNCPASNGRTPLQIAAKECRYGVIQVLLERGASPREADGFGTTPLHELSLHSFRPTPRGRKDKPFFDAAFLLVDANSDLDARSSARGFLNAKTYQPQNALELATKAARCFPLIQLLALAGSSPNHVFDYFDADEKDLPPILRKNQHIIDWLRSFYAQPRSLKELCRRVIRRRVGRDFAKRVAATGWPIGVREYLHFSDLRALRREHSLVEAGGADPDDDEDPDRNSESEYNPSTFRSEYGDNPNIVDTDDEVGD